jgi:hypothetical protein
MEPKPQIQDRRRRSDGDAAAFGKLIPDFLSVHHFKREYGGYRAFEGEVIADGKAIQADRELVVFVSTVLCRWPEQAAAIEMAPSLWFRARDESGEFNSFAAETDLVLEALNYAGPSSRELQIPIPAVKVRNGEGNSVVAGDPIHLRICSTLVEPSPGSTEAHLPAPGIRFDTRESEREKPPAYSFAMAGLTPFLALSAALDDYSGPTSFALELEELRQDIEKGESHEACG